MRAARSRQRNGRTGTATTAVVGVFADATDLRLESESDLMCGTSDDHSPRLHRLLAVTDSVCRADDLDRTLTERLPVLRLQARLAQ